MPLGKQDTKFKMKVRDLMLDLVGEACKVAVIPGDNVIVEEGSYGGGRVFYSRHCGGGAYISAFNFYPSHGLRDYSWRRRGGPCRYLVLLPIITEFPEGWKNGEPIEIDIHDPSSTSKMAGHIKAIFSLLQEDRNSWHRSPKSPYVSIRHSG